MAPLSSELAAAHALQISQRCESRLNEPTCTKELAFVLGSIRDAFSSGGDGYGWVNAACPSAGAILELMDRGVPVEDLTSSESLMECVKQLDKQWQAYLHRHRMELYAQLKEHALLVLSGGVDLGTGAPAQMPVEGEAGRLWTGIVRNGYGMFELMKVVDGAFDLGALVDAYVKSKSGVAETYAQIMATAKPGAVHALKQGFEELKRVGKLVMTGDAFSAAIDPVTGKPARPPWQSSLWIDVCKPVYGLHYDSFRRKCQPAFNIDFMIIKSDTLARMDDAA